MNVVIYARFSSHSQTEQSIKGQLKVCYEYAESHNYTVVGEYIDRAQSGKFDNRAEFQRMIADSDKHTFDGILVYQLDRFARNRYDSAIYKAKLKKNGIRVLSAKRISPMTLQVSLSKAFLKVWRNITRWNLRRRYTGECLSMPKNAYQTAAIRDLGLRSTKQTAPFMLTRKKRLLSVKYLNDVQVVKPKRKL